MSNRRKRKPSNGLATRSNEPSRRNQPPAEQHVTVTEVTEMIAHSWWSGPLPQPDDLARYEQVAPGSAERIIRMAEEQGLHVRALENQQSAHRQAIEVKIVKGIERRANIGQWLAAFLALGGFAAGCYIAVAADAPTQGASVVAVTFGGGALVWFLGGRPPRSNQDDE